MSETEKPSRGARAPRAPRAFNLDGGGGGGGGDGGSSDAKRQTGAKSSVAAAKKAKSATARKRAPKSFEEPKNFRETPDDAAQRFSASEMRDLQQELQLAEDLTPPPPDPAGSKRRFGWGWLFWLTLSGLVSLSLGLWLDQLLSDLFARNDWLGWAALGLTGLLLLAITALVLGELAGLSRMARIDRLRSDATAAAEKDDMAAARKIGAQLTGLYANRPDTAQGRARIKEHAAEIIDGRDLLTLYERDLMRPLDQQGRTLVMNAAKRVSIVTAVSPRALIDIGYVLYENVKLIRSIADLYGGRPGKLGFWRLARNVVGHLAVTGSIAIGEGVIQQLVGQGVAAKLSSRLGEGVINGMLTARIGIAAIDLCRPLPFTDQSRPSVSDFMGELVSLSGNSSKQGDS